MPLYEQMLYHNLDSDVISRNQITPGTPFMKKVTDTLAYYAIDRLTNDPGWAGVEVVLSDASVPGEGEHKLMVRPLFTPSLPLVSISSFPLRSIFGISVPCRTTTLTRGIVSAVLMPISSCSPSPPTSHTSPSCVRTCWSTTTIEVGSRLTRP